MARKIIVTRYVDEPGRDIEVTCAMWCDVPVERRPYWVREGNTAEMTSRVHDATGPEVAALQDGSVREYIERLPRPPGTSVAAMKTVMQTRHAELQTETNNYNPWKFAGSSWDGTTWTNNSVA
jgi:hypothetical protein